MMLLNMTANLENSKKKKKTEIRLDLKSQEQISGSFITEDT